MEVKKGRRRKGRGGEEGERNTRESREGNRCTLNGGHHVDDVGNGYTQQQVLFE
jgi:hypothetical protein